MIAILGRITPENRIKLLAIGAALCFIAALALLPRAVDAVALLLVEDDPAAFADRRLEQTFTAEHAAREIEGALAAGDADLAGSFLELARDRGLEVAPDLAARTEEAVREAESALTQAQHFTRGLITGEPDDLVSLAGTALGDLFVFGDIRDALREGTRLAAGQEADRLILGLSGVGIAITAGTYATLGAGAPARVGLSVMKAARRAGKLSTRLGESITRSLRNAVDWPGLRSGFAKASLAEPAVAVRAIREAVKVGKADDLLRLTRDVGRVQGKAGTKAALDGLKIAQSPREVARIARLAEVKGGKTRAVLKFLGRGAIALTIAAFDLSLWIFWALLTLFGFVTSAKSAVERATLRGIRRRKARRIRRLARQEHLEQGRLAMPSARG